MAMNLKNKRLLIMGGNQISWEIIHAAKRLGCFVGVTDYYPIEKSPGKQIADAAHNVSTIDIDAMVSLIKKERYDGIFCGFVDMLLPYYAKICEKTNRPAYGTEDQFKIFTNKNLYKPLLREYGIPTIKDYSIDPDNIEKSTDNISFPVLVKPSDGSGSRGISVCYNAGELKNALVKAGSFSKTGEIIVEQYIEGREATINWVFQNGEYYLTSISNRHVKYNQDAVIPLPVGYTYPSHLIPKYRAEIEENCKKMFRDLGIKDGMLYMQCKVVDNVCIVYDIGYRLTGALEYKNINDVCGYNPMDMLIHFAITGNMGEPELAKKVDPTFNGRYGFNVSTVIAPCTIGDIQGVDVVKSFPGVIDSVIDHYPGTTISEDLRGHLTQLTVRTLGTVNTEEELYPMMKKIENSISVFSTEGIKMNLPGIETEDIQGYVLNQ